MRRNTRVATANARGERLKYCTERSSLVLTHEPVVLGHGRLDLVAPVAERGGVERDALDRTAGCVAALVVRVVVAPAGAPHQPNALAQQEVDHLDARGEEHLAAGGRRRRTDVADRRRRSRPGRPRASRGCPPPASAGCSAATPCRRTFRSIRRREPASRRPAVRSPRRCAASAATIPPPPLPAISRSTDLSQFIMSGPVSVRPRSATGTSIVVFVFWIAGTSRSYGRPARKPSMTRSKFEISPSISVRQPHVLEPLGVQALLLLRQVGEVLGRDHRPARVVGRQRLRRGGPALRLGHPGSGSATRPRRASARGPAAGSGTTTRCCTAAG